MKKLLLGLLMMLSMISQAQIINGIEIGRLGKDVNFNLTQKGFKKINQDSLHEEYVGILDGKIVRLSTTMTPKSKIVWKMIIEVDVNYTWDDSKKSYFIYKEFFNQRYYNALSFEFFISPYYDGDGHEIQALILERCNYHSFFTDFDNNSVEVLLKSGDENQVYTWIVVENKIGCDLFLNERIHHN